MLKKLHLKDFTLFEATDLEFGRHLNVFVGENGAGKTHILKAAYCGLKVSAELHHGGMTGEAQWQVAMANKLSNVFRPDELGRLVRRGRSRSKAELAYSFDRPALDFSFAISRLAKKEVTSIVEPQGHLAKSPVYVPTRELLTLSPWFIALYKTAYVPFEETWYDTCLLLEAPLARGPREATIKRLLVPLEEAMGGKLELSTSGFYLHLPNGTMEMHVVAEGLRKLAMVARLIATGFLLEDGCLFWDEPETNLNPRILKRVARTILSLARSGVQVFVATHSLFLVREFQILGSETEFEDLENRYFGLQLQDGGVRVSQGATMDDVGDLAALDEELLQSDRYLDTQPVSNGS